MVPFMTNVTLVLFFFCMNIPVVSFERRQNVECFSTSALGRNLELMIKTGGAAARGKEFKEFNNSTPQIQKNFLYNLVYII